LRARRRTAHGGAHRRAGDRARRGGGGGGGAVRPPPVGGGERPRRQGAGGGGAPRGRRRRARRRPAADGAPARRCGRRPRGAGARPGDAPLLMAALLDGAAAAPGALARRLGAGEWGDSAASRAVVGAELLTLLDERLTGPPRRVYEDVEKPLQAVLADMELAGIKLDLTLLAELSADLAARLEGLEARLRVIADDPGFNVASRDQVADLLYRKLGLRPGRRTATGKLSTAVSALEPLTGQHEAVDLILEHRELAKLKNTYLEPLAALADERGRVHTTFQQAVVATGRLSSVNPNLQ